MRGTIPNTLVGRIGSDLMYRKCRFVYYAQSITSRRCATRTEFRAPTTSDLQTLSISEFLRNTIAVAVYNFNT